MAKNLATLNCLSARGQKPGDYCETLLDLQHKPRTGLGDSDCGGSVRTDSRRFRCRDDRTARGGTACCGVGSTGEAGPPAKGGARGSRAAELARAWGGVIAPTGGFASAMASIEGLASAQAPGDWDKGTAAAGRSIGEGTAGESATAESFRGWDRRGLGFCWSSRDEAASRWR
jgi:hypothetical protein